MLNDDYLSALINVDDQDLAGAVDWWRGLDPGARAELTESVKGTCKACSSNAAGSHLISGLQALAKLALFGMTYLEISASEREGRLSL